jgi:hypothetical protein
MARSRLASIASVLVLAWISLPAARAEVSVEESPKGAVVKIDGQVFTEYVVRDVQKPILWPVNGPGGKPVTQVRPKDHVHHGSIWFTHGDINGIDFWSEKPTAGKEVHRQFVKLQGGATGTIIACNDWISSDGRKELEDQRVLGFGGDDKVRWIDIQITLKASERPLHFGDTKEGSMGVRVAETIRVDAKQGGRIVNSRGKVNADAWGQRAEWVDYVGPVDGETLGIAFFNHPSSFRFPTPWHVRTYGLYAANPFGVKSFPGTKDEAELPTLAQGESLVLRYRILLHRGSTEEAKIAEAYGEYSRQ